MKSDKNSPQRTQSLFCPADRVNRAPIGAMKASITIGNFVFLVANKSTGSNAGTVGRAD
jgi:hypothetical protein